MTSSIPDCPVFEKVTVAGVDHTLTQGPKRLDQFLIPALRAQGLASCHDAGASDALMPTIEEWWPDPECPVITVVEYNDGEKVQEHPRWPGLVNWNDETRIAALIQEYPTEEEEIRAYCLWLRRKQERYEAIKAIQQQVEAMGALRRRYILQDVVAALEAQQPGLVRQLVSKHCSDNHKCSCAEHDVPLESLTPPR